MPQPYQNAVMTDQGALLLTKAQAGEIKIEFTRMVIGDGVYAGEEKTLEALQAQETLKSLKNSYPISSIAVENAHSVRITSLITNQDPMTQETVIEEGFYINEIGLMAKPADAEDGEVLYSIAVTAGETGDFMPPYNGFSPAQITQDYYATVNNSAEVVIHTTGAALLVEEAKRLIQEGAEEANRYADQKITELINGAPENLDTLRELADAMAENKTLVQAVTEAIAKKVATEDFQKHVQDAVAHITSQERDTWNKGVPNESASKVWVAFEDEEGNPTDEPYIHWMAEE